MEAVQITVKYLLKKWKDTWVENMEAVTIVCAANRKGIQQRCLHCPPRLCSHQPPWNYPQFTLNPGEWAGPRRVCRWCDSAPQTETQDPRLQADYSRRDSRSQFTTLSNTGENTRNILEPADKSVRRKTDTQRLCVFHSRYRNTLDTFYESEIE